MESLEQNSEVIFKLWQSTDRATLNTLTPPTDEFIQLAASQLNKMTAHSFIAKSQEQHLKIQKNQFNLILQLSCLIFLKIFHLLFKMRYNDFSGTRTNAFFIQ